MDPNTNNNQQLGNDGSGAFQSTLAQAPVSQAQTQDPPLQDPDSNVNSISSPTPQTDDTASPNLNSTSDLSLNPKGVVPSPSPEIPTRIEKGTEIVSSPESASEDVSVSETEKMPQPLPKLEEKNRVDAPEVIPNLTKFENPFKVYGYKVSDQVADMGQKLMATRAVGDVSSAKTWLLVLVGRLLRMGSPTSTQQNPQ
ncbi:MAG: hypothetical protein ABIE03_07785 [Patescibacteria group bacterium]|nr:hypothetical protein [Patescibacteria group bacterium]